MQTTTNQTIEPFIPEVERWQLKMFRRSIKKQQKLAALLRVLGPLEKQKCLLLTCGDNNGALNWYFKQHGGDWSWADAEHESVEQILEVTGDAVAQFDKANPLLPFSDNSFDVVLTIDVHEHLEKPGFVNKELYRVVKPSGRVIVTTPGGNSQKLANRIKHWLGMRKEDYGHIVDGYESHQLAQQLVDAGFSPKTKSSYSRFFTEIVELAINLIFVKVLARRKKVKTNAGQIAPQNKDQIKSIEKTYKIYTLLYPFILAFSKLDNLIPFLTGYAAIVAAEKE
jgi:ubiquinone/menaquinone biosynthesis C-methylase UbiE